MIARREARPHRWARPDPLLDVGLTGGIASGKSTVTRILQGLGARVFDADAVVHELLAAGRPEARLVLERFGPTVRAADGGVDRAALAAIVFADPGALEDLNALVHPAVRRELDARKEVVRSAGGGVVITDAALLVETGAFARYDRLIVVACDPGLQLARLLARSPELTVAAARARIAAQAPVTRKVGLADYVIDTSGTLADTDRHSRAVWDLLRADLDLRRRGEPLPERRAAPPEA